MLKTLGEAYGRIGWEVHAWVLMGNHFHFVIGGEACIWGPLQGVADAHQLALASFHRRDILLPWNCKHLANANKKSPIQLINSSLDLHMPQIITPLELIEFAP